MKRKQLSDQLGLAWISLHVTEKNEVKRKLIMDNFGQKSTLICLSCFFLSGKVGLFLSKYFVTPIKYLATNIKYHIFQISIKWSLSIWKSKACSSSRINPFQEAIATYLEGSGMPTLRLLQQSKPVCFKFYCFQCWGFCRQSELKLPRSHISLWIAFASMAYKAKVAFIYGFHFFGSSFIFANNSKKFECNCRTSTFSDLLARHIAFWTATGLNLVTIRSMKMLLRSLNFN